MNKSKRTIISIALLSVMSCTNVFAAQFSDEILDIEKVAGKAIETSAKVRQQEEVRKQASKERSDANMSVLSLRQYLGIPVKYLGLTKSMQIASATYCKPLVGEYKENANQQLTDVTKNGVRIYAYQQYGTLAKVNSAIDIQKKLVASTRKSQEILEAKLKAGLVSENDVKKGELAVKKTELDLQKFYRNQSAILGVINKVMGTPIDTTYAGYISDNIKPAEEIRTLEEYTDSALKNRIEVVNKGQFLEMKTKVNGFLNTQHRPFEDFIKDNDYEIATIKNDYDLVKLSVQMEINSAYNDLKKMQQDLETLKKKYEIAEYNYNRGLKLYEIGMITEKDSNDLNLLFSKSAMEKRNMEVDLWFYQTKLDFASDLGPSMSK